MILYINRAKSPFIISEDNTMNSTLKRFLSLVVCLVMLALTACGNSNRSEANSVSVADTNTTEATETAVEAATETVSIDNTVIEEEAILAEISQYKEDFRSGKWDGSPIFIGGNVLSIDPETAKIWLNDSYISDPLYYTLAENERCYSLDQDEAFMYYYLDVESEEETKYFILRVNKQTGDTVTIEIPEETYSAKLVLENVFVRGKYSLYRIDFRVEKPELVLMENCISDYEVRDFYSSIELHYITGERIETGISFDKESGAEEVISPHKTSKARYSNDEGELTFYDNPIYSKARELYANKLWEGEFTDLHTLDESIPENTFAKKDYDGNIIINNKVEGKYYRAIQVEPGCNVSGTYYGDGLVWFEDGFNQYLRFYFPGQEEDYCIHSYGTDLPFEISGYTRIIPFFYESDLTTKTAGARVYILTDGELWYLDCNFLSEQVKTKVLDGQNIVDFNWAYDTLYYMLDTGEVYTIHYGEDGEWDFKNPTRFGGDKVFYALSHHTDEREGALSLDEGNYEDSHLYSPYGD